MSPEPEPQATQELPVEREKLKQLWQKARDLLERAGVGETNISRFIVKEGRLIQIECNWNSVDQGILDRIAIRSWNLSLPGPGDSRPWDPYLLRLGEEVVVSNPGVLATPDGQGIENYSFYGKINRDWVDSIEFPIATLLEYPHLGASR